MFMTFTVLIDPGIIPKIVIKNKNQSITHSKILVSWIWSSWRTLTGAF